MRIKLSWLMLAAVIPVATALLARGPAWADGGHKYSNADAKGIYSWSAPYGTEWVMSGGTSTKYEISSTVQLTLDGKGHFTGPETDVIACAFSNCGMTVCSGTNTGTYKINPDGSGTTTVNIVYTDTVNCPPVTGSGTFNLSDGGKRIVAQFFSPGTNSTFSSIFDIIGIRLGP